MSEQTSLQLTREKTLSSGISVQGPLRTIPDAAFLQGDDFRQSSPINKPFENHAWVYSAIRAISLNLSGVPFKVQVGSRSDPKDVEIDDPGPAGDLKRVLEAPNEFLTGLELKEATIVFQELFGMCFWVLERNNPTQIPKSIIPVSPNSMEPVLDDKRRLIGWVWFDGTEMVPLLSTNLVIFKFFNPYDPIKGLAPLQAASAGVTTDYLADVYGNRFFANNGVPDGIVSFEKRLKKEQQKQFIETWEQRHRGAVNAHKLAVITGGGKWQKTGMSQRDMEFVKQKDWTRKQILAVFKVPESEVSLFEGIGNSNNARSQDQGFWKKTLVPLGRNHESSLEVYLTRKLRISIPGLRLFYDYSTVEALQESLNDKITNAQKLHNIGFPINMINRVVGLGMDRVEWGDTWFINRSFATVEDVISGEAQGQPSGPSITQDPARPQEDNDPVTEPDQEEEDPEVDEESSKELYAFMQKMSAWVRKEVKPYLYRLKNHQVKLFCEKGELFVTNSWDDRFNRKMKKIVETITVTTALKLGFRKAIKIKRDISFINDVLASRIKDIISSDEDMEVKKTQIKEFFKQVRSDKFLQPYSKWLVAIIAADTYQRYRSMSNAS